MPVRLQQRLGRFYEGSKALVFASSRRELPERYQSGEGVEMEALDREADGREGDESGSAATVTISMIHTKQQLLRLFGFMLQDR
jgi:hypothetical protein